MGGACPHPQVYGINPPMFRVSLTGLSSGISVVCVCVRVVCCVLCVVCVFLSVYFSNGAYTTMALRFLFSLITLCQGSVLTRVPVPQISICTSGAVLAPCTWNPGTSQSCARVCFSECPFSFERRICPWPFDFVLEVHSREYPPLRFHVLHFLPVHLHVGSRALQLCECVCVWCLLRISCVCVCPLGGRGV